MATRISASTTYLSRSANLPAADPITVCMWLYLVSDLNAAGTIWVLTNNVGTQFSRVILGTDGTTLTVGTQNGTTPGTSLSTATWYHIAYTRSGANHTVYLNGVSDSTRSDNNTLTTPFAMLVGSNTVIYLDARVHDVKIWAALLTQGQIQQEMQTNRPNEFGSLHIWSPTFDGTTERARDYSGNGYNWTENGSLTDEDPPPLSWGSAPIVFPIVTTVAGSLSIPVAMHHYQQIGQAG